MNPGLNAYTCFLFLLTSCNGPEITRQTEGILTHVSAWITEAEFEPQAQPWNVANDTAYGTQGNIFVVGTAGPAAEASEWIVRRSRDGGDSWQTIDKFAYSPGHETNATSVVRMRNGDIFVAGYGVDASGISHWLVRKSTDDGASWLTVDDYALTDGQNARANSLAVDQDYNLFVGGYANDANGLSRWVVRKSLSVDGGFFYSVTDNYAGENMEGAALRTLEISPAGHIYAGGVGDNGYVRKSSDSGKSWTTDSINARFPAKLCTQWNGRSTIVFDSEALPSYVVSCRSPEATHAWETIDRAQVQEAQARVSYGVLYASLQWNAVGLNWINHKLSVLMDPH